MQDFSLGTPEHSLSSAREKAKKLAVMIADGEDPAQQKRNYRDADTFSDLCQTFAEVHLATLKEKTKNESLRIIERELIPEWDNWKVREIQRRDVINLLDKIRVVRKAPTMAQNTKALISKIFNFAIQREIIDSNPCLGIGRQSSKSKKDRCLDEDEIRLLLIALEEEDIVISNLFKVILLTAQRPGEVASMKWEDIHLDQWTIPASETKNKKEHIVPLSNQVLDIIHRTKIATQKQNYPESQRETYVFPSPKDGAGHIKWLQKATRRLISSMNVPHWTPHDLRRTAATHIRSLNVSRDTLSKILNHSLSNSVTAVYDRYDELKERRRALTRWADRCDQVCGNTLQKASIIKLSA